MIFSDDDENDSYVTPVTMHKKKKTQQPTMYSDSDNNNSSYVTPVTMHKKKLTQQPTVLSDTKNTTVRQRKSKKEKAVDTNTTNKPPEENQSATKPKPLYKAVSVMLSFGGAMVGTVKSSPNQTIFAFKDYFRDIVGADAFDTFIDEFLITSSEAVLGLGVICFIYTKYKSVTLPDWVKNPSKDITTRTITSAAIFAVVGVVVYTYQSQLWGGFNFFCDTLSQIIAFYSRTAIAPFTKYLKYNEEQRANLDLYCGGFWTLNQNQTAVNNGFDNAKDIGKLNSQVSAILTYLKNLNSTAEEYNCSDISDAARNAGADESELFENSCDSGGNSVTVKTIAKILLGIQDKFISIHDIFSKMVSPTTDDARQDMIKNNPIINAGCEFSYQMNVFAAGFSIRGISYRFMYAGYLIALKNSNEWWEKVKELSLTVYNSLPDYVKPIADWILDFAKWCFSFVSGEYLKSPKQWLQELRSHLFDENFAPTTTSRIIYAYYQFRNGKSTIEGVINTINMVWNQIINSSILYLTDNFNDYMALVLEYGTEKAIQIIVSVSGMWKKQKTDARFYIDKTIQRFPKKQLTSFITQTSFIHTS